MRMLVSTVNWMNDSQSNSCLGAVTGIIANVVYSDDIIAKVL